MLSVFGDECAQKGKVRVWMLRQGFVNGMMLKSLLSEENEYVLRDIVRF